MQLHLIFCLLHVQGQLKTSWSCSLERKDFHKSPGWYMSSLTRALLSVAKLQSQNDGRSPARGIASFEYVRYEWFQVMQGNLMRLDVFLLSFYRLKSVRMSWRSKVRESFPNRWRRLPVIDVEFPANPNLQGLPCYHWLPPIQGPGGW